MLPRPTRLLPPLLLAAFLATCNAPPPPVIECPIKVAIPAEMEKDLDSFIRHEIEDKKLPGLSIALLQGDEVVWSRGYGLADPTRKTPATPGTVWRVGSVSKLFTDLAAMKLVERGRLDLDKPLHDSIPEFQPVNPFGGAVTLRHLMSHRAGILRETPVGSYFDPGGTGFAATAASMRRTTLVYAPGSRAKYSNAGVTLVGAAVENAAGTAFGLFVDHEILQPLGLVDTAFHRTARIHARVATGRMWTVDGREFDAPTFELGILPAGNLYSTMNDLVHFAGSWFAPAAGATRAPLWQREMLEQMWTPQFAPAGTKRGIGLGFFVGDLDGQREVGHSGAVYGHSTVLLAVPERRVAAACATNMDFSNVVPERVCRRALRWLIADKEGRRPPLDPLTSPVGRERALRSEGRFADDRGWLELDERGGELIGHEPAGFPMTFRSLGAELVVDDRIGYGDRLRIDGDTATWRGRTLRRVARPRPAPAPAAWRTLIGEYGWDHDVLYVMERDGQLCTLIEWFATYPLTPVDDRTGRWKMPDAGLYAGEAVDFRFGGDGRVTGVEVGGVLFPRRKTGPEDGGTFRITPLRPVADLRAMAQQAQPPAQPQGLRQPELVPLDVLDTSLRFDLRYATDNNFMGAPFYGPEARALMQRPAADALVRAHKKLAAHGLGILVRDAYRPWTVTKMFWDGTPENLREFVADPSRGSRHNRGCAADVTLFELATGQPIEMPSGYDEFTPRAYPDYPGGTSLNRWHRNLLRRAMEDEGFKVYEHEWWHFDHQDWQNYPVMNVPFS